MFPLLRVAVSVFVALVVALATSNAYLAVVMGACLAGVMASTRAWAYGGTIGLLMGVFAVVVLVCITRSHMSTTAAALANLWDLSGARLLLKTVVLVLLGAAVAETTARIRSRRLPGNYMLMLYAAGTTILSDLASPHNQ